MSVNKIKTSIDVDFKTNIFQKPQNNSNTNNLFNIKTTEVLDLGLGPVNHENIPGIKAILEKYPELTMDDTLIIDFLIENPQCKLIGTEKIDIGNNTIITTFEIWDSKNQLTYYVDKDYTNSIIFNETVKDINEVYEKCPELVDNISEVVFSSKDNPGDAYWQSVGRPGKTSSGGGLSTSEGIGKTRVTFYPEWENEYNNRNSQYGDASYIFTHEAAHAYDYGKDIRVHISDNPEWDNAMAADREITLKNKENGDYFANIAIYDDDRSYINSYAYSGYNERENTMRNDEDFAESISIIVHYGYDAFEKNYPNRAQFIREHCPELYEDISNRGW